MHSTHGNHVGCMGSKMLSIQKLLTMGVMPDPELVVMSCFRGVTVTPYVFMVFTWVEKPKERRLSRSGWWPVVCLWQWQTRFVVILSSKKSCSILFKKILLRTNLFTARTRSTPDFCQTNAQLTSPQLQWDSCFPWPAASRGSSQQMKLSISVAPSSSLCFYLSPPPPPLCLRDPVSPLSGCLSLRIKNT